MEDVITPSVFWPLVSISGFLVIVLLLVCLCYCRSSYIQSNNPSNHEDDDDDSNSDGDGIELASFSFPGTPLPRPMLIFGGAGGHEDDKGEGKHAKIGRRSRAYGGHLPTDDFTWSPEDNTNADVKLIRKSESSTDFGASAFENVAFEEERTPGQVNCNTENSNSTSSELLRLQRDSSDSKSSKKYSDFDDYSLKHCDSCNESEMPYNEGNHIFHDSRNITVIVTSGVPVNTSCEGNEDEKDSAGDENKIVLSVVSGNSEEDETFPDEWIKHTSEGPSTSSSAVRYRPVKDSCKDAEREGKNGGEDKNKIVLHVPGRRREEREENILDDWPEDPGEGSTPSDHSNVYQGLWCRTDSPNYPVTRRASTAPSDLNY